MYVQEQVILKRIIPAQSRAEQVEAVIRDYSSFVYRIAYAVLRHPQEAEDAAQETFIRVWKHSDELSGVLNQRAWLARIAWRIASDWRKKHRRAEAVGDDHFLDLADGGTTAEEHAVREQRVMLLERMVAMLPEDLRAVVELSTVEEMTSAEIAEALSIPESSVRGRLLRARQMLREKIQVLLERKQKRSGVGR